MATPDPINHSTVRATAKPTARSTARPTPKNTGSSAAKKPTARDAANVFRPGPNERTLIDAQGKFHQVPATWELLPPGDPLYTRRVKAAGEHWCVQEKVGRKIFSKGIWAPADTIAQVKKQADAERSTEAYAVKREKQTQRRDAEQAKYVEDFVSEVRVFLHFAPQFLALEQQLAQAVAEHATPVGSGTVARTKRISIEQRAESAVIAWMRHQTTAYDAMKIPRQKGARHEVRRMLAARSRELLESYRRGEPQPKSCPLQRALVKL